MEENNEQYVNLCLWLKDIAKGKGITDAQIAEKTGFKQPNVNRMLNGKFPPNLRNFLMLCDAIEVEVELKCY